jgi:hypothetical protein
MLRYFILAIETRFYRLDIGDLPLANILAGGLETTAKWARAREALWASTEAFILRPL